MSLVRRIIRTRFALTTREAASALIEEELSRTLAAGEELGPRNCSTPVTCPRLLGVDEDMRDWSFHQILEHNGIVNEWITGAMRFLAGNGPPPDPDFDSKRDVMPGEHPGPGAVEAFRQSVAAHLEAVAGLGDLKGTRTLDHPIFGPFDAHRWHCMFGFHLQIHRKQADSLVKLAAQQG